MRYTIALIFLLLSCFVQGQNSYPQDYFRNPLDIPIFLAGNFGECRPGHFHSGVDIKTLGKENQPVHAAADGYISRIKMEKGGFGHGLYITHPNGYTTLYAHLNDFAPAIQKFVRAEQYEKKRWDVDLQIPAGKFPVKKGELIAYSGNTGASTAPHLHFEIRDNKTEHPLNPEKFGLPVVDHIAPVPVEVYCYNKNSFYPELVNGGDFYSADPLVATLALNGGIYKPVKTNDKTYKLVKDTLQVPGGLLGIGVNVDDFMDGSDNTIAFYTAALYMDDMIQAKVTLDDIGYDESRYINAYADYKTKTLHNKWSQCLFQLPGNRLNIYSEMNGENGRLNLKDMKIHKISIVIVDDKGNTSKIQFFVSPQPFTNPEEKDCTPFYCNKINDFSEKDISFSLDERQLYDNICFQYGVTPGTDAYSDKFQLHQPFVPLHHFFDLKINPNKTVPGDLKDKIVMMYSDGKSEEGSAAKAMENGWYKAAVRNFGTYWLDADTTPPVIKSMQKNNANLSKAKEIVFDVKDDMTSVRTFSGYVDGKWLCFEQHGSRFFYRFDAHCPKGKHKLVFKAADENGNESQSELNFVR